MDLDIVKGFTFSAVEAAIKKPGRLDLGLIHSSVPAKAVGFFTSNAIQAAPVKISRKRLASGLLQSVVVNSGNANACTGEQGLAHAEAMASLAARGLGIDEKLVAVCSTGVIGRPLPIERIQAQGQALVKGLSPSRLDDLARAIMTTDTVPKTSMARMDLDGTEAVLVGTAKGAGMIHPNLEAEPQATMLAFLMTDAAVSAKALREAMDDALPQSFHGITIDGDTSTNDTLLLMANGLAGNPEIEDFGSPGGSAFYQAVGQVCRDLAWQLVADAEGGTKVVTVQARGCGSEMEADMVVMAVALSPLCKTAFFGADPNWGRIIAAAGYSGARVEEEKVRIGFDEVIVFDRGKVADEAVLTQAEEVLKRPSFKILVDLGMGEFRRDFVTSDMSVDYVRINSEYTT